MNFKRFISILFLFQMMAVSAIAQTASIRATTDKNQILIGEPFQLTIQVSIPQKQNFHFSFPDSITHFEILGKPVLDSVAGNNSIGISAVYKLTSFDSGRWAIPPFILTKNIQSDSVIMDVVFSDFNAAADYHDIKDIIEVKPKTEIRWWRIITGAILLLLLIVYYFIRKKIKNPIFKIETPVNPYQLAMKQMNELRQTKTDSKSFHTKLIDIFRQYLFYKNGILSSQKTTEDLVPQLKSLNFENEQLALLVNSLRLSDMVKFAKYQTTNEENELCFNRILDAIKKMEKGS